MEDGGSDITAIALAKALNLKECEIFKDVDGIYSDDPNKNKKAKKYQQISYDKMIEMAKNGAKKENIKIIVKSTFDFESIGTIIDKEGEKV